jgi:ferredoxin
MVVNDVLASISQALAPSGIAPLGSLNFDGDEGPCLMDGSPARSVVLLGNIGGSAWKPFSDWRATMPDGGGRDPLDTWSETVIRPVAETFGATAYFPSQKPWQPFQQWAMQASGLEASPLGILAHPEYGLWHGFRGALGFAANIQTGKPDYIAHPCRSCEMTPCTTACPVGAITEAGFDVAACRAFLAEPAAQSSCMQTGCIARNASPVGAHLRYSQEQLRFHMEALGSF